MAQESHTAVREDHKACSTGLRIAVLGARGIPGVQGGIETHCEKLYPLLVQRGHQVTLIARRGCVGADKFEFEGVKIIPTWAPSRDGFEAALHTFFGIFRAWSMRVDVLHLHAVGPALFTPLARLLGMKVVVTHHGPDYDRQKWSWCAKQILKLGESMGAMFAQRMIVISETIRRSVEVLHERFDTQLIFNGVDLPVADTPEDIDSTLCEYDLVGQKYVLGVGRLVPEKGFHDLIEALGGRTDIKVVIAGDATQPTAYSEDLKKRAAQKGVLMVGFVKGPTLRHLFRGASLFAMPSYHEGLPIALLEAMSFGKDVLVSDIPANLDVNLQRCHYFKTGDVEELRARAIARLETHRSNAFQKLVAERYNWSSIAIQTEELYMSLFGDPEVEEDVEVAQS